MPRFDGVDAVVLGVSPDSVESHAKFRKNFDLTFPLLADTEHDVAEAYGVWGSARPSVCPTRGSSGAHF
jgi:peroxiredoxin Q/BCP